MRFGPVGILGDEKGVASIGTRLTARVNGVVSYKDMRPNTDEKQWFLDGSPIWGEVYSFYVPDRQGTVQLRYSFITNDGMEHQLMSNPVIIGLPDDYFLALYKKHLDREPENIDPAHLDWWKDAVEKLFVQGIQD